MFWNLILGFECSQVRYRNSTKGAKTESQVCDRWRVNESCRKFLDKLLTSSVTENRGSWGWGTALLVLPLVLRQPPCKDRPQVLPTAVTCLHLQVLLTVCELFLLWRNSDGLFLHFGPERGAFADSKQIPSVHFLYSLPDRYALNGSRVLALCVHWVRNEEFLG